MLLARHRILYSTRSIPFEYFCVIIQADSPHVFRIKRGAQRRIVVMTFLAIINKM